LLRIIATDLKKPWRQVAARWLWSWKHPQRVWVYAILPPEQVEGGFGFASNVLMFYRFSQTKNLKLCAV
jgi:hypothetical protein